MLSASSFTTAYAEARFRDCYQLLCSIHFASTIAITSPSVPAGKLYTSVCYIVIPSRSEAGVLFVRGMHSSKEHCVALYRPISTNFTAFFPEEIALSDALHSLHFRR